METSPKSQSLPVVIMCGGMGTRLREETEFKPKPMVEIGGRPILWHIMKIYAHYGYKDFVLCLGYRGSQIKEYFLNHRLLTRDFHLDIGKNAAHLLDEDSGDDFRITFVDTGESTLTGERLLRAAPHIPGDEFMLTYGDGVSDVDLYALENFYYQKRATEGVLGTITAIHPKHKYGLVNPDDRQVITSFTEKPRLPDYTNGGFMVLHREFMRYCKPNQMIEEALIDATADRKVAMFKHEGFWHSMDTYKDKEDLEKLWLADPKWKVWDRPALSLPTKHDLPPMTQSLAPQKNRDLATPDRLAFWKDRNVFVTGGYGLLGSALVELLHSFGARVVVLKRDHVPSSRLFETPAIHDVAVVNGDFENYQTIYRTLNEYEIDTVLHVGAQPIAPVANRAPVPTLRANILGTWNVLEAARLTPTVKRVIVASSDKAYGAQPVLPYSEDAPLRGRHPYDVSKSCADLISQMYHNTFNLPVCVTRCGNLYGPGDLNWSRVIPDTIRRVLKNGPPVIRSDGKFIRDYFFVRDAANAYLTLAEQMHRPEILGEAFNFSTGNRFTVLDIVARVQEAAGTTFAPEVRNEAKAEIHDQTLSSDKAKRLLGWEPRYTVEEGMAETIAWYRRYLSTERTAPVSSSADVLLS